MHFDLNPHLIVSQLCETLAPWTNIAILDYHQASEEILSKLCGNRYGTRNTFHSVRKYKEVEGDQLSKTQEAENFAHRDDIKMLSCNTSLDHPSLFLSHFIVLTILFLWLLCVKYYTGQQAFLILLLPITDHLKGLLFLNFSVMFLYI